MRFSRANGEYTQTESDGLDLQETSCDSPCFIKYLLNAASTVQQAFCLRLCNVVLYCRSSFTE